jgi:hypothetical protein
MVLPADARKFSPKKFTQPQLFACLLLTEFLRLEYRKLEAFLRDAPDLAAAIELKKVPDHSSFQKAAKRLLGCAPVAKLLTGTLAVARVQDRLGRRSKLAALDGTGWESRHASRYFVSRRAKGLKTRQDTTYRRFPTRRREDVPVLRRVAGADRRKVVGHLRPCELTSYLW